MLDQEMLLKKNAELAEKLKPYDGVADAAISLVEKLAGLLEDEDQKQYYAKVIDGMHEAAKELIPEIPHTMQKNARLLDASVRYANQIAYHLFLNDKLTDDSAKELRKLPSVDETAKVYKAFEDANQEDIDLINDLQQEVLDNQKDIDKFTAILLGNTREEVEKKFAEYEQQTEGM